jgi:hypothetical protein
MYKSRSKSMTMERPKWLDAMEVAATKALDDILKEIDEDNGPSMADIAESVTELDEEEMQDRVYNRDVVQDRAMTRMADAELGDL